MFELTYKEEATYQVYADTQFIGSIFKYDRYIFASFRDSPLPRWMNDEIEVKVWRLNNEHQDK